MTCNFIGGKLCQHIHRFSITWCSQQKIGNGLYLNSFAWKPPNFNYEEEKYLKISRKIVDGKLLLMYNINMKGLHIQVSEKQLKELREFAKEEDVPYSGIVRQAIKEHLEREKAKREKQ